MLNPHEPDNDPGGEPGPCQAIPSVARRGWRPDVLCASTANSEVSFCGRLVAVCRIHRETYMRWGSDAERKAAELWDWHAPPAPSH